MFILNFALYVMVICMGICYFSKNEALDHNYFNLDEAVSKPARFTGYAAIAFFVVWIASILIVPLVVVLPILKIAVIVLTWWWLIETVQNGNVRVWFQDAKAYFDK